MSTQRGRRGPVKYLDRVQFHELPGSGLLVPDQRIARVTGRPEQRQRPRMDDRDGRRARVDPRRDQSRRRPLKYRFERMDAGENAFFSRQLEHIRPGLLEVQYQELKGTELIPTNGSVHIGAEDYTYRWYDQVGKAALVSSLSKRGPRADVHGHEATSKIRSVVACYGYSIQEGRAAQMAKLNLDQRKAKAARRAIAEELDRILLMGDGSSDFFGLYGLFQLDDLGVHTFVMPDGESGTDDFEDKTPDEAAFALHDMARAQVEYSKEVEKPDTLVLPLSDYGYLSTTRIGDGSETTILNYFLKNSPYIKKVESHTLLETAGVGGIKRSIMYKKDPDKLEAILPIEFEQFAPQWDGFEVLTDCHARTGGVVLYFPKSVTYTDYGS